MIHLHKCLQELNPEQFQPFFLGWIKSISNLTQGEVIAIDGKTLRHYSDRSQEKSAIQMVSGATNNRLVLGRRIGRFARHEGKAQDYSPAFISCRRE